MRVLMVVLNRVGRGTYWRAALSGRELARRGHDVTVMAMSPDARIRWTERAEDGVRIIETPDLLSGALRSGWDPWDALRRTAWVRRRTFDIVHAMEARPIVLYPALAAQRRGAKLVMDWADLFGRGGSVEERPNPLVRAVLRPVETHFEEGYRVRADGTVVISKYLRQRAIALGVPPEEILILPDGADVDRLHPTPRDEARQLLGWPADAPIIGYVGAIFRRDAELMAAAFDLVRRERPDAELLLAGYFNAPFEALTAHPAAVRRTGTLSRDRVALVLSACDVCWLPMRDSLANRARYPLKVKDYMCVARPVVISDVGDVAQLVRDGGFGLVAADRAEDLAAKALALLADAGAAAAMGARGRCLAETEHTWDRFADRLEAFYGQVLGRGNP